MEFNTNCEKDTKEAKFNEETLSVENYKESIHKGKIFCKSCDSELVYCNMENGTKYFRHKVSADNPMTQWHNDWQNNFGVDQQEVCLSGKETQIKSRRLDVGLGGNLNVEIQHSNISRNEIQDRKHDYALNGYSKTVWIVHGNNCEVKDGYKEGKFVHIPESWKSESFKGSYEFILLDVRGDMFKVPVDKVRNGYICLSKSIPKNQVIEKLKSDPENVWDLWEGDNFVKPYLAICQYGAGNGKTFALTYDFIDRGFKTHNIWLCNTHSGVHMAAEEYKRQIVERYHEHVQINVVEDDAPIEELNGKQKILSCRHKGVDGSEVIVLTGTIDSFLWRFRKHDFKGDFENLAKNVADDGTKLNSIVYGGHTVRLNTDLVLSIDEAQDISINYYNAFIRLMKDTNINVIAVGDKLQSLHHGQNFMTIETHIPDITVIHEEPKNINRRIKTKNHHMKINKLVRYEYHGLKAISVPDNESLKEEEEDGLFFEREDYDDIPNQIVNIVKKCIESHGFDKPNDYSIIFPFLQGVDIADSIEMILGEFWANRYSDDNKRVYVQLHRASDGRIDLETSIDRTRIVTTTTAKGDGRPVIICINLDDSNLNYVSGGSNKDSIRRESHINVSLTRAKNLTYVIYNPKRRGNMLNRFKDLDKNVFSEPEIKTSFSITKIAESTDELPGSYHPDEIFESIINGVTDWEYYVIRRSIAHTIIIDSLYNRSKDEVEFGQIKTILEMVSRLPTKHVTPKEYINLFKQLKKNVESVLKYIPICVIAKQKHHEIFEECVKYIQKVFKNGTFSFKELDTSHCVALEYLFDMFTKRRFHSTMSIYNALNIINEATPSVVSEMLNQSKMIEDNVNNLLDHIQKRDSNVKYNTKKIIMQSDDATGVTFIDNAEFLGHTDDTVYHIHFETDMSDINSKNVYKKINLIRNCIRNISFKNPETDEKNKKKFSNKKVVTYILILKQNKFIVIEDDVDLGRDEVIRQFYSNFLKEQYMEQKEDLFKWFNDMKNDRKVWSNFQNPYEYTTKKRPLGDVIWLVDLFENLQNIYKQDKTRAKSITDNREMFFGRMKEEIDSFCKKFVESKPEVDDELF